MTTSIHINELESLLIAIIVLFLGYFINTKVKILRQYNIPEPIVGGLVIAFIITFFHFQGYDISFKLSMQDTLMQMFFATVGLAASYKLLMKGGSRVFLFLGIATIFIIIQDAVGVGMSKALGLDPLLGLIVGSITLSGGHGTGAAWSQTFATDYGLNTLELSMAAATFGLIMGGIIGGPIAQRLINKHKLKSDFGESGNHHIEHPDLITYSDREEDRITSKNTIEVLFILLVCVAGASHFKDFIDGFGISALRIPEFVYALFIGVFITNLCEGTKCYKINKETVDALGTISLSLFLAMALMSLHLWELMDLAMPMLIILAVQTVVLGLFTYFVTFRVMGSNYDAAVIAGGHCGFGMGATPTDIEVEDKPRINRDPHRFDDDGDAFGWLNATPYQLWHKTLLLAYQVFFRFSLLLWWGGVMLPLTAAIIYEGYNMRQIKMYEFKSASAVKQNIWLKTSMFMSFMMSMYLILPYASTLGVIYPPLAMLITAIITRNIITHVTKTL